MKEKFLYLYVGYFVYLLDEVIVVFKNGVDLFVYGYVFLIDCKKGVLVRGFEEILDIVRCLFILIIVIGGIILENIVDVFINGVSGIVVMFGIVSSSNLYSKVKFYKELIRKWVEKYV